MSIRYINLVETNSSLTFLYDFYFVNASVPSTSYTILLPNIISNGNNLNIKRIDSIQTSTVNITGGNLLYKNGTTLTNLFLDLNQNLNLISHNDIWYIVSNDISNFNINFPIFSTSFGDINYAKPSGDTFLTFFYIGSNISVMNGMLICYDTITTNPKSVSLYKFDGSGNEILIENFDITPPNTNLLVKVVYLTNKTLLPTEPSTLTLRTFNTGDNFSVFYHSISIF